MFGICCAPELFQKVMESILAGLEGVIIYLDDIVVYGRSKEEHDRRLSAVLQRLAEYEVLLNKKKCVFDVESLEFLGHELSVKGVRPTESRVAAIQNFREPQNVSELRSFLGLICYVGRFMPDLASRTASLRQLLRADVPFKWTVKESTAFKEVKNEASKIDYLGFFDPKDRTKLIADASPCGLGAVLLQEDSRGQIRIIAYASKALSDLEKKYFQTEREALALVWSVEKFKLYLQGTRFTLLTDCKALKFLFSPKSRPCARIERWVLQLQAYTYDIEHIPGAANIADALSRLSTVNMSEKPFDESIENYIQSIAENSVPFAVTFNEIVRETEMDPSIQEVLKALQIKSAIPKEYQPYENELCAAGGVLLRGNRLVIPKSLRDRVLAVAHEAHPGIAAMKRRLRQKVWWPSIDKQTEECVKRCKQCILVSSLGPPEPLLRSRMPEKPWSDIAIDFMGPLPSGHNLLVMVDYFSRFTEVVVMKQITATRTVQVLHETFCRFGVPESIRADNGPQFISGELSSYCKEYGIELRHTTPYWPQANGEVERANKTILKHLKISQESSNHDWIWDLRSFLLMYNSTPHATTGAAPSKLMFGRLLRDKLPTFEEKQINMNEEEIRDRDWTRKLNDAKYADIRRRAEPSKLKRGDKVVAKRMIKENKLSSTFMPEVFEVINLTGSEATLQSTESDRVIHRNVSHLKPIGTPAEATQQTMGTSSGMVDDEHSSTEASTTDNTATELMKQHDKIVPQERPIRSTRKPAYLNEYQIEAVEVDKV